MKAISHRSTLVYYDGVQVFEGRDKIGGHYLGVLIETSNVSDRYLIVGVEPELLRQFRVGELDLRTLLLESSVDEWFTSDLTGTLSEPWKLEAHQDPLFSQVFLPEEGFLLNGNISDDGVVREALARRNVVLEFSAEPPEAATNHRIRADTLGRLLIQLQTVIKHAYRNALRDILPKIRNSLDVTDGHLMDVVVPAQPGSFKVKLEAAKQPDMFGSGEVVRALRRLDDVFESAKQPSEAFRLLEAHKGHLAGSYIRLMKFLAENKTGLWYTWADPMNARANHGGVSEGVARTLARDLSDVTSLSTETISLVGEFDKVNRTSGDWGLLTDDGIKSGKITEDGPILNGLQVGKRYQFHCVEHLDIIDASGRERRTLYLRRIEQYP